MEIAEYHVTLSWPSLHPSPPGNGTLPPTSTTHPHQHTTHAHLSKLWAPSKSSSLVKTDASCQLSLPISQSTRPQGAEAFGLVRLCTTRFNTTASLGPLFAPLQQDGSSPARGVCQLGGIASAIEWVRSRPRIQACCRPLQDQCSRPEDVGPACMRPTWDKAEHPQFDR